VRTIAGNGKRANAFIDFEEILYKVEQDPSEGGNTKQPITVLQITPIQLADDNMSCHVSKTISEQIQSGPKMGSSPNQEKPLKKECYKTVKIRWSRYPLSLTVKTI